MDRRDRDLLAGLARVNADIGKVTLDLLTLQPSDEHYAAGLRKLGHDLVQIGVALARRAHELDGQDEPSEPFGIEAPADPPP
ncbi:hypothetical protein SD37_03345 [Amycolatopsis orientalis]|uniref:Uncharacterized protein n=1 Tax=Amycolatopsis orientalis TaxID=31958 RepID=A0A193BRF5_AMYOR|nr:hypothetical protein [Amycolatopsis orientalis]ANN14778.1 hypothetical protein SD37_03345 [Amycolatopsis orientalis]